MRLLRARWLLPDPDTLHDGGGVLVRDGLVTRVLDGPAALRRCARAHGLEPEDLGRAVLTAGLIDAHAHLDLTALAGRVPAQGGFGAWVSRLLAERGATPPGELTAGVRRGADRLLATGTTWVGDVDATGLAAPVLRTHALGAVVHREVLDAGDSTRSAAAFAAVASPLVTTSGLREGLSPHAPFSVTPALLARLARLARERCLPVAVHWSETAAEIEWLREGSGPLADLLGSSPRRSGLDLLEQAGLLGPRTALIHGNLPEVDEPARLAAAGASLVHCPGTQRFFDRPAAPLERYLAAGVNLALGTDSRASNDDLDMRRELALLRAAQPALAPREVWAMATTGGARALGLADAGQLAPGTRADLVAFAVTASTNEQLLDELTAAGPPVLGVWIGGERAQGHV